MNEDCLDRGETGRLGQWGDAPRPSSSPETLLWLLGRGRGLLPLGQGLAAPTMAVVLMIARSEAVSNRRDPTLYGVHHDGSFLGGGVPNGVFQPCGLDIMVRGAGHIVSAVTESRSDRGSRQTG